MITQNIYPPDLEALLHKEEASRKGKNGHEMFTKSELDESPITRNENAEKKKSDKKQKKKKKQKKAKKQDYGRGVDTMYRTSYRMKLGFTSLADGKANIMITVNSLSLTVIAAAGGFLGSSEPWLLLPISVFLICSLGAMVFAVLATRPEGLKDNISAEKFMSLNANLLDFNNFSVVSEEEYLKTMNQVAEDKKLVYDQMARDTYGLGCSLIEKYRLLKISYTIYAAGLILTIILLLGVFAFFAVRSSLKQESALSPEQQETSQQLPGFTEFHSLNNIYEPSGVHQLPDGRFIVVEDEMRHPLSILSLNGEGLFVQHTSFSETMLELVGMTDEFGQLNDLEALDVDDQGYVYAITSHSRTEEGKKQANREKLIRFQVEGDKIVEPRVHTDLKKALTTKYPFLEEAAAIKDVKDDGGFNIEGLAFNENQEKLMIGFRSPLVDGKAVIVAVDDVDSLFEQGESAPISEQAILIDLNGEGIRGMTYDSRLGGYLIISKAVTTFDTQFNLWFWKGSSDSSPQKVTVPGLSGFAQAEGITPVKWNGQERLLLVSDDGSFEQGRSGQYLLLKYEQLVIEAPSTYISNN